MSVYKEGYHAIQLIESQSKQIFSDSCDFGAPTRRGDLIWNVAKQLVDQYGVKETRQENHYETGRSVDQRVELMDEWAVSDERKTEQEAIDLFIVSFVSCSTGRCRGYEGYVVINKI